MDRDRKPLAKPDKSPAGPPKSPLAKIEGRHRMRLEKRESPGRSPTTTAFTREVIRIHQNVGLNDRLIARATGAALNTVRDWLASRGQPSGVRAERIGELGEIVDRLGRVIEPEYIPLWLAKPVAALDDEKPIDVLRRGGCVRVARLVSSLEDSGAA